MCGIVAVTGHDQAKEEVRLGMLLLQHRGQDAAGLVTSSLGEKDFDVIKAKGLVKDVITSQVIKKMSGRTALGHTRYPTAGGNSQENYQPYILVGNEKLAVVHNGNVVNYPSLRKSLISKHQRHILGNNDVEVFVHLMDIALQGKEVSFENICKAIQFIFEQAIGAYSVLIMIKGKGLVAFRDPYGIRPLSIAKKQDSYCFSSETNVQSFLSYDDARDLGNGEVVFISDEGKYFSKVLCNNKSKHCMFEWLYFSNPESSFEGIGVYKSRLELGVRLAEKIQSQHLKSVADVIVPIPDSGRISAITMSEKLSIPYRELLIKNRYVQRSFIQNGQSDRVKTVNLKLMPVIDEIKNKRILLVDDSIVRGTTSKIIVKMLKKYGAREVLFASTCPPIIHPCFYGIDFPDVKELVAHKRSIAEIQKHIGLDGLFFLDIKDIHKILSPKSLCDACLTGKYPAGRSEAEEFVGFRMKQRKHVTDFC